MTVDEIKPFVDDFIETAKTHPHKIFLVTEIGCGLAGHNISDIAPLFKKANGVMNIALPKRFVDYLNHN